MTKRTRTNSVTFSHPFTLTGLAESQPAGVYAVETEEELIQPLSFVAYRRAATWLTLARRKDGGVLAEIALVDPIELEEALAKDIAAQGGADAQTPRGAPTAR